MPTGKGKEEALACGCGPKTTVSCECGAKLGVEWRRKCKKDDPNCTGPSAKVSKTIKGPCHECKPQDKKDKDPLIEMWEQFLL